MTKKLATSKAPNSYSKAAEKIKEIIGLGWVDIPDASSYRGHGTAGRMIEFLLDLKENNNDSPDLFDWEIKTHGGGPSLITLFHKELDKDFKITLPKLHQFAPAFAFLVFTSFVGGYASDNIIASLEGPSDDQLAANKPTPSIDVILASTTCDNP